MAKPLRKQGKIKGKQSRVWWGNGSAESGGAEGEWRKKRKVNPFGGRASERASVHMLVNTKLDIFIGIIREYLLAFEDVLPYPRAS